MKIEIVTLFPDYFTQAVQQSLMGKAIAKRLFDIEIIQLRDFATDRHRTADDAPFGGGGGMVLKLEPLDRCLESLGYGRLTDGVTPRETEQILLTSAGGRPFMQDRAVAYSLLERLTIICGHYLGVDERLMSLYPIEEVSIGDYILSGGEPAAAVISDAVVRLIPGVLGNFESAMRDAFMDEILGAPCYTRPAEYRGLRVPEPLVSGHHAAIKEFERQEALRKCHRNRPELIQEAQLTDEEKAFVRRLDSSNDTD